MISNNITTTIWGLLCYTNRSNKATFTMPYRLGDWSGAAILSGDGCRSETVMSSLRVIRPVVEQL